MIYAANAKIHQVNSKSCRKGTRNERLERVKGSTSQHVGKGTGKHEPSDEVDCVEAIIDENGKLRMCAVLKH